MRYYGVGLYIPIIATYIISKDKLGVLLGTAIVNIAGIIGAYVGSQLTYKVGTRRLCDWFQSCVNRDGYDGLVLSQFTNDYQYILNRIVLIWTFWWTWYTGKTIAALSFPTYLRSQATGFVESVSRTGSIIGTFVFPIILLQLGLTNTMLILAIVPLVGFNYYDCIEMGSCWKECRGRVNII